MSALEANPFFVLELPVTAGPREVEREAARLLGMLELGLAAAATYPTPLGPRPRRAEDVRAAAAALRDPAKRLVAELWTRGQAPGVQPGEPTKEKDATATEVEERGAAGWADAFNATGWGRR